MTDSSQDELKNISSQENGYPKGFRFLFALIAITWLFLGIQVAVNNLGSSNTTHLSSQNDDNRMLLKAHHFKIKALEKKVESMSRELDYITKNYLRDYKPESGNSSGVSLNEEDKSEQDETSDITENNKNNSISIDTSATKPQFENMAFENKTASPDISEIKEKSDVLEKQISDISQEMGKVSTLQNSNNMIIAAAKLKDAVKSHKIFSSELDNFSNLAEGNDELASDISILKKSANSGIATSEQLMASFNDVADKILLTEKKQKENPTFSDKIKFSFAKIVKVRKIQTDTESNNTEDVLARAYNNLLSSDIENALKEMQTLDENLKPTANEWTEKAEANINSITASEKIFEYVTKPSYTSKVF